MNIELGSTVTYNGSTWIVGKILVGGIVLLNMQGYPGITAKVHFSRISYDGDVG